MIKSVTITVMTEGGDEASTTFEIDHNQRARVVALNGAIGDARISAAILTAGAEILEAVYRRSKAVPQ